MNPLDVKRGRRLRQTISLKTQFDCRQFNSRNTSLDIKHLLPLGYEEIMPRMKAVPSLLKERRRLSIISSMK